MVSSIPSSDMEYDGCARVCRFALDLMKSVKGFNDSGPQHGTITLRVGISVGSVVAGVVGTKRYLFDIWGDAGESVLPCSCGRNICDLLCNNTHTLIH